MTNSTKVMFLQKPIEVSGIDGKITCFYRNMDKDKIKTPESKRSHFFQQFIRFHFSSFILCVQTGCLKSMSVAFLKEYTDS